MNSKDISLAKVHIAVLLFGVSGLFGKLISLPPMIIVLGRVFFSTIFLLLLILSQKQSLKLKSLKDYFFLILSGLILVVHWGTFFKSIQLSTVAIGLLTFSTFPIFVTFLEPYFFKEKIKIEDIIIAFITLLSVLLITPNFKLADNYTQGALWGIISGFTYAVICTLNKKYVKEYSSIIIAFYQQLVATIALLPFLILNEAQLSSNNLLLLVLLGVVFTGISHSLFISSLKSIKVHTASIISSLEPVYGIIFAFFILDEIPSLRVITGGIIILFCAFYKTISYRSNNNS